jgi:hypothetical protein
MKSYLQILLLVFLLIGSFILWGTVGLLWGNDYSTTIYKNVLVLVSCTVVRYELRQ